MAHILGVAAGELLLEISGEVVPDSKLSDVQFGDFIRCCLGLRPLTCDDDARGRRGASTKKGRRAVALAEVSHEPVVRPVAPEPLRVREEPRTVPMKRWDGKDFILTGETQTIMVKVFG
jgi:hypothetical protein